MTAKAYTYANYPHVPYNKTASMGNLLDSDKSGFLPLLILASSSFSSQFLTHLRVVNLGTKPLVVLSSEAGMAV